VLEVPAHRLLEPWPKLVARPPSELAGDLLGVHGVTAVVTRAISDIPNERLGLAQDGEQRPDHGDVGLLGASSEDIRLKGDLEYLGTRPITSRVLSVHER